MNDICDCNKVEHCPSNHPKFHGLLDFFDFLFHIKNEVKNSYFPRNSISSKCYTDKCKQE